MEIRLTDAELFVIAGALEGDLPSDMASERSQDEESELWTEGMKSLIARYLVRRVSDTEYQIDNELSMFCAAMLSSETFVSLATENADGSIVSTYLLGEGQDSYSLTPVVEGVWQIAGLPIAQIAGVAVQMACEVGPVSIDLVTGTEHKLSHRLEGVDDAMKLDDEPLEKTDDAASHVASLLMAASI